MQLQVYNIVTSLMEHNRKFLTIQQFNIKTIAYYLRKSQGRKGSIWRHQLGNRDHLFQQGLTTPLYKENNQ